MINLVRDLFENGEDSLYLYNPQSTESVVFQGEQVFAIGNHNSDGWKFNLNFALRQTLYVLMAEDQTNRKYVILITDRIDNSFNIEKYIKINYKEMIYSNFIIICVGENFDKKVLEKFNEHSEITYLHINQPDELEPCLLNNIKEKKNGQTKSYCETNERCEQIQLPSRHNSSFLRTIQSTDRIDTESVQAYTEQLLPIVSGGRLLSEPRLHSESVDKFSEKCSETTTAEFVEHDKT